MSKAKDSGAIDAPIPFLQPDANGHFSMNEKAAKILDRVKGKVVVIAVAGPYRTGKSYLLNRMIDASSGFAVGSSVNACTKGIWLWGSPIYDAETNTTFVFLDTEGLNSTGEEYTFDTQIFSLSVLLSSVFVLNTQGTINEAALEQLELVAECSKAISFRPPSASKSADAAAAEADDDTVEAELAHHFPSLVWVLRDFSLRLENKDGNPITPNEHLERVLQPLPANVKGSVEKNRIRRSIVSCFLSRECQPLVRPVVNEDDLQRLAKMPKAQLRPEFESGVARLRDRVFAHTQAGGFPGGSGAAGTAQLARNVKLVNGRPVTGSMLVGLAREYCTAINTGKMPSILSAWQSVVELKAKTVAAEAQQGFLSQFNAHFAAGQVFSDAEIRAFADDALAAAVATVTEALYGADEAAAEVTKHLDSVVYEAAIAEALSRNAALSVTFCRDIFSQLWDDTSKDAPCSHRKFKRVCAQATPQDVTDFVSGLLDRYRERARGPGADEVERDILERLYLNALHHWDERERLALAKLEAARAETKEARTELDAALKAHQEAATEAVVLRERVSARDADLAETKKRAAAAEAASAVAAGELAALRVDLAAARAESKRAAADAAKEARGSESALRDARAREDALRAELADVRAEGERAKRQWSDERTVREKAEAAREKAESARERAELARDKAEDECRRANDGGAAAERRAKELSARAGDADALRRQLAEADAAERDLQKELAAARREVAAAGRSAEAASRAAGEVSELKAQLREANVAAAQAQKAAAAAAADAAAAEVETAQARAEAAEARRQLAAAAAAGTRMSLGGGGAGGAHRRASVTPIAEEHSGWADGGAGDDGYGDDDGGAYAAPAPGARSAAALAELQRRRSSAAFLRGDASGGWEQPNNSYISPVRAPGMPRVKRAYTPQREEDEGEEDVALPPTAEPVRDPTKLTIKELRSWLTSIDFLDHQNAKTKAALVDLVKKHDPRLRKN